VREVTLRSKDEGSFFFRHAEVFSDREVLEVTIKKATDADRDLHLMSDEGDELTEAEAFEYLTPVEEEERSVQVSTQTHGGWAEGDVCSSLESLEAAIAEVTDADRDLHLMSDEGDALTEAEALEYLTPIEEEEEEGVPPLTQEELTYLHTLEDRFKRHVDASLLGYQNTHEYVNETRGELFLSLEAFDAQIKANKDLYGDLTLHLKKVDENAVRLEAHVVETLEEHSASNRKDLAVAITTVLNLHDALDREFTKHKEVLRSLHDAEGRHDKYLESLNKALAEVKQAQVRLLVGNLVGGAGWLLIALSNLYLLGVLHGGTP